MFICALQFRELDSLGLGIICSVYIEEAHCVFGWCSPILGEFIYIHNRKFNLAAVGVIIYAARCIIKKSTPGNEYERRALVYILAVFRIDARSIESFLPDIRLCVRVYVEKQT